jgi:Type I phosphodiesterase / nucleotide pyrophosphatase
MPAAVNPGAAEPTLPQYGQSSLAALATSILDCLGVPGEPNPLRLPPADRICLLLVDGLGWDLLKAHPAAAPFMSELTMTGALITAGFPATTATSMATLGTGRPPGQHGVLGYQVAIPGTGRLLNALHWDDAVDPCQWQPGSTIFDRAVSAGVAAVRISPKAFQRSGLSGAALRGAGFRSANTLGGLVWQAAIALAEQPRALVLVYFADLDSTGHRFGCSSDAWVYQLAHVDKLAEQLAGAMPHGTTLYITADHGMVDVPAAARVDADTVPELRDGVALLGGEGRARHVYCVPGAADDVLAAWRGVLGDRAWVASRAEAVAAGWFGQVDPSITDRIGDIVAAARGSAAVVASKAEPLESGLIGMHGSLTPADQLVPLLSLTTS